MKSSHIASSHSGTAIVNGVLFGLDWAWVVCLVFIAAALLPL